jgi:hypothetical protein
MNNSLAGKGKFRYVVSDVEGYFIDKKDSLQAKARYFSQIAPFIFTIPIGLVQIHDSQTQTLRVCR